MATAKKREEFIARLVREYPGRPLAEVTEAARKLLRHARTHGNLAVQECNGPQHLCRPSPYDWQKQPEQHAAWSAGNRADMDAWAAGLERRQLAVEKRIREICAGLDLPVTLGGDPRGYTVKVKLPSGASNTWGGSADDWGVPQ